MKCLIHIVEILTSPVCSWFFCVQRVKLSYNSPKYILKTANIKLIWYAIFIHKEFYLILSFKDLIGHFWLIFFRCTSLSSWSSSFFSPDPLGIVQANFARKPNFIKHHPTHSLVKGIHVYLNKDYSLFKARW